MNPKHNRDMNRRTFVKNTAVGCISAGMIAKQPLAADNKEEAIPKIKEYRTLGRTGFKASDVGLGTVLIEEGVLRFALDAGVNYLDSSPIYRSEDLIGKCINNMDRKSVFITTKFFPRRGQTITKEAVIKSFRNSLEKLNCGYVDCLMLQSVSSSEVIKDKEFHEAIRQLKNEEKLRFCGAACHGSEVWIDSYKESMEQIMGAAIEDGRYDVLLFVYNFLQQKQGKQILQACKDNNIGTTIMKSNPVSKLDFFKQLFKISEETIKAMPEGTEKEKADKKRTQDMYDKIYSFRGKSASFREKYNLSSEEEFNKAAIRFVLSNKNVSSVLASSTSYETLEATLLQSGKSLAAPDKHSLLDYEKNMGRLYCRHACGECESQCPHKVPVNTIMRYNHYMVAQGLSGHARNQYAQLSASNAELCKDCEGYCETACPYQVSIRNLLCAAHNNLALT